MEVSSTNYLLTLTNKTIKAGINIDITIKESSNNLFISGNNLNFASIISGYNLMDPSKQKLLIEQADRKLAAFKSLRTFTIPQNGWINTIRIALKMSLRQLGNRLNISPQSMKEIEEREANGSLTIKSLKEVGAVLDMKLIYGFIPKSNTIDEMIEKRAMEVAKEIISRTTQTMKLEDQENSNERLKKALKNKTEEIKTKMPKYIWD